MKNSAVYFKFQINSKEGKKSKTVLTDGYHFNRIGGKLSIHVTKWANTAVRWTLDATIQLVFGEFLPWEWCCTNK